MRFFNSSKCFLLISFFAAAILYSCKVKKISSSDFTPEWTFTKGIEGPAVDKYGKLYAVNFEEQGTIGVVDKEGNTELFVKLPEGSIGNGIRFDVQGHMYVADYTGHTILQIKKGTKTPEVLAHEPEMSQPNDLAISPNGILYLSDPNWKDNTGRIWMVNKNNEIILLEKGMGTTNGIEVDPNGKILYVNESVQRNIWKYDIDPDGTLSNKRIFHSFGDFGLDGMRCDSEGNLYVTRYGKGTVIILSPEAETIAEVQLKGKNPSNITFGGEDGKTCFVTMADRGCFEYFKAPYQGNYYNQIH